MQSTQLGVIENICFPLFHVCTFEVIEDSARIACWMNNLEIMSLNFKVREYKIDNIEKVESKWIMGGACNLNLILIISI